MGKQVIIFISQQKTFDFFIKTETRVKKKYFRCDLSLSGGAECSESGNPLDFVNIFEKDLLIDNSQLLWDLLSKKNDGIVDIVLDNAGYELFTDLSFAAFITSQKLTKKIRFYVKRYPWYVSDVTLNDFHWTIDSMKNSSDENLKSLGEVCQNYLTKEIWTIEVIIICFNNIKILIK